VSATGIAADELRESFQQVLNEEGEAIASALKAGCARQASEQLWNRIAPLGWLGLSIEECYGGLGLGLNELGILYEELGRVIAPAAVLPTMLAAQALMHCGDDLQKETWLPRIASGEVRATLALPLRVAQANQCESGPMVVPHVLQADAAALLLLPIADAAGQVKLALLSSDAEGVVIDTRPLIDLSRTMCTVSVEAEALNAAQRMNVTSEDWDRLLDHACLGLACDSVGGAARILEKTVEYMGVRKQFDVPIGSFQALKHRAATWKILLESIRALTEHSLQVVAAQDDSSAVLASAAKYSACDAYVAIAGDSVQLHGGIGFTWEHDCHLFLKRAKLNAALFGNSIQHKERVAGRVFADDLDEAGTRATLLLA
jgi:alkylation response protein AidB-like acyl-CoA dehydrogenase